MIEYSRIGVLLLVALALGWGAVSAVSAVDTGGENPVPVAQPLLILTKELLTTDPIFPGDRVDWKITLVNQGDEVQGIVVTDTNGSLILVEGEAMASMGTFDDATLTWDVGTLASGVSATLTLATTVPEDAAEGDLQNCAAITSPAISGSDVCTSAGIGPSTKAEITIKPETLNMRSRGVFTVFIKFSEEYPLSAIDLGKSSLVCNGAEPKKLHATRKDGGTLMAKYRRQDLVDVIAGDEVTITCEGTIMAGEETVKVTGSDTVRVIGEKKKGLDAFFAGILDVVLPLDDEAGEAAEDGTTAATTPTPGEEQPRNRGQLKKANGVAVCTGDCTGTVSHGAGGKGKKSGTDDQGTESGSGGKGKENGNGNGKGNGNKPDTDKGKGNGKK